MATGNWNTDSRRTVVGYFVKEEDASLAIQDLIAAGFRSASLGAAFPTRARAVEADIRPIVGPGSPGAGTTPSGPASDSSAVTAAGLSAGSGTIFSGASRPGPATRPIPGAEIPSELPSSLPHSIPSALPSSLHPRATVAASPMPEATAVYPAAGVTRAEAENAGASWSNRLRNVFGREEHTREVHTQPADKTSQNFGTGEGHLGVDPDYVYSDAAFESAFFGLGVEPGYARQLSGRLRSGGAIVTIETTSAVEASQAEQILERNGGSARMETGFSTPAAAAADLEAERRMELFGRVRSVYPGYVSSGVSTRKAS